MRNRLLLWIVFCVVSCVFWVLYTNNAYSYSFFDSSLIHADPVLSTICWVNQDGILCDNYSNKQKDLDKKLSKFFALLNELPDHKRRIFVGKIWNTIPYIDELMQRKSSNESLFTMLYVKAVFIDILKYYEYQDSLIKIDPINILWNYKSHDEVRREIINNLISNWRNNFIERPYVWDWVSITTADDNRESYNVLLDVSFRDDLDVFLENSISFEWENEIVVSPEDYLNRSKIALFKSYEDIRSLWYNVVSHRRRITTDKDYRRYNIAKSFSLLWHVRVLNPWDTLSFLEDSQFDPNNEVHYQEGKVIFLDEEVDDYGWWLCWWSTALYQWVVTNKWLDVVSRNHTKWYSYLYTAVINWEEITIPWLDSTIYYPYLDLKIKNVASYPIILVSNFSWNSGEYEEVFTLWKVSDRWNVTFVESYDKSYTITNKEWKERKTDWECYDWIVNWEEMTRCYKELF